MSRLLSLSTPRLRALLVSVQTCHATCLFHISSAERSGSGISVVILPDCLASENYLPVHADAVMQSLEAWNCICNCYTYPDPATGAMVDQQRSKRSTRCGPRSFMSTVPTYPIDREHEGRTSQNLRNYCLSSAAPSFGRSLREEKHSSKRNMRAIVLLRMIQGYHTTQNDIVHRMQSPR
jgi:hypothetical protein